METLFNIERDEPQNLPAAILKSDQVLQLNAACPTETESHDSRTEILAMENKSAQCLNSVATSKRDRVFPEAFGNMARWHVAAYRPFSCNLYLAQQVGDSL